MEEEVRNQQLHQPGELRQKRRKKRVNLPFNWFFWTCCLIIAIPCVYFVVLLVQAAQVSNTPINGDRFKNTIIHQIDDSQVQSVISAVNNVNDVENCTGTLIVSQLRLVVDAKNALTNEEYQEILDNCYKAVTNILDEDKYFSIIDEYKQYDLQIDLYDDLKKDEPISLTLIKNSSMESYRIDIYSQARNEKAKEDAIAEITDTNE